MKPRVFVSSTYYDLKYVRENLEHFIQQYGFDAVLFESGNVTFEHGKALDFSCYKEVDSCHMMILIIGGRYGSASSTETEIEIRKKYDEQYISITRNEFDTARLKGIPCFVFIDKNVHSEYYTYKKNQSFFDNAIKSNKNNNTFSFAHVDSVNIFKFIDHVNYLAIKTFEKAEDIVDYLRNQLAGMFFLYLDQLQKETTSKEILNTVEQLNNTANKIDTLVEAVAKKLIDEKQLNEINNKQFDSTSELFAQQIENYIHIALPGNERGREIANELTNLFIEKVFNKNINITHKNYKIFDEELYVQIHKLFDKNEVYSEINQARFTAFPLHRLYKKNIEPFIDNNEKVKLFRKKVAESFHSMMLPF
ncbi:DUF4062 domain-containing protein [Hymenobacter sp. DG01]|uniref:DUF4062 domain-containing protein n=1 Tax=Hymenobacter sp. DG01 TaxID=2584940 RepID=UPI00111D2495|nr:DUF4062 domain-containing protein [Hymenobacter sp. DG01]